MTASTASIPLSAVRIRENAATAPATYRSGGGGRDGQTRNAILKDIFRQHAPRVFTIARRLLADEAAAENVTRDVLQQVANRLNAGRDDSAFDVDPEALLVEAVLACRCNPSADSKSTSASEPIGPDRALSPLIDDAIAMLDSCDRSVYVLADVEGFTQARIGELLGMSVVEVKARLHRSRVQVRTTLALQLRTS